MDANFHPGKTKKNMEISQAGMFHIILEHIQHEIVVFKKRKEIEEYNICSFPTREKMKLSLNSNTPNSREDELSRNLLCAETIDFESRRPRPVSTCVACNRCGYWVPGMLTQHRGRTKVRSAPAGPVIYVRDFITHRKCFNPPDFFFLSPLCVCLLTIANIHTHTHTEILSCLSFCCSRKKDLKVTCDVVFHTDTLGGDSKHKKNPFTQS